MIPNHASLPVMHLPRNSFLTFYRAERPVSRKMEALMPSSKNAACGKGKRCNFLYCTLSRLVSACHASCGNRLEHAKPELSCTFLCATAAGRHAGAT